VDGKRYTNINDILTEEIRFYKDLYSFNDNIANNNEYLNNITLEKSLNIEDANRCGGVLTLEECTLAVREMKKNKSPGLDGLTSEFYQVFWNKISKLVLNSLNEGFQKGELSFTQKQSVLSLIFKKVILNRSKIGDQYHYLTLIIRLWLEF
jgi:hypothetical protein